MRLFLDTANIDEIEQGMKLGVISGVTTNPSLAAKEGIGDLGSYQDAIRRIAEILPANSSISVEVTAQDSQEMIRQSRAIAEWHPSVIVKLPSTIEGFHAMAAITQEGIQVNQTLCFSVNQALLGAQLGVTYVSPFVGRLDDEGHQGMDLVGDLVSTFRNYPIETQVLAASIRHPLHCVQAAKVGAHIASVPFKVLMQMTHHPLTDAGNAIFNRDWDRVSTIRV